MGATSLERLIAERQREGRRAIGRALLEARLDRNLSIREVSRAAGLHHSHLPRVESGDRALSHDALVAIATVLGFDVSLRLFQSASMRLRDHAQVLLVEAVLAALAARWLALLEVPVWRPTRGVIDLVLRERSGATLVAGEAHSLLHAVEAQLRHAHEKTDGLPSARGYPWSGLPEAPQASRLLVLRSCTAMHRLVASSPALFSAAYPGNTEQAVAALKDNQTPWPGPSIVWVRANGTSSTLLTGVPRAARPG